MWSVVVSAGHQSVMYTDTRVCLFTVQQVFGAQVDVDAAVEAGDQTVENTLLQTQT